MLAILALISVLQVQHMADNMKNVSASALNEHQTT
jgi:hypothetical protein